MEQSIDLYSILTSYSNDINSPYIDPESFVVYLEGLGKKNAEEHPEWLKWADGAGAKFWTELANLAEEGKCELLHDTPNGRVYMPSFHHNLLEKYYSDIDNNADFPLPGEESFSVPIPENQIYSVGVGSGLGAYLKEPKKGIIRISFPNDIPSVLVLSEGIPQRLIEACLYKIRNYLRESGNKEFAQNKIASQLMGKDPLLREILNKMLIRPQDCFSGIFEGGEFPSVFWAHFCALIKDDIEKKKSDLSRGMGILQAAHIIETLSGCFKAQAIKTRERETAFRTMEQNFIKPPYIYSFDEITKFTNPMGSPLLGQYSEEELSERLKKLSGESKDNKLPELLILTGPKNEQLYVSKTKLVTFCNKLIDEAREKIKNAVSERWQRLIKNFQTELAMESNKEFEEVLFRYTRKLCPLLSSILEDPGFPELCNKIDPGQETPFSWRPGASVPYSAVLRIRRTDILEDTRLFLPFWYSIPFIVYILAFFMTLANKKPVDPAESSDGEDFIHDDTALEMDESQKILEAVRKIEYAMVPQYHTLESYLEELKFRWVRLIDRQARENLVEDVNSLVRDNLRQTLRVQKHYQITRETLGQLAVNILNRTPSLDALSSKDSLRMYIELYLVKLLESFKINFQINEAP